MICLLLCEPACSSSAVASVRCCSPVRASEGQSDQAIRLLARAHPTGRFARFAQDPSTIRSFELRRDVARTESFDHRRRWIHQMIDEASMPRRLRRDAIANLGPGSLPSVVRSRATATSRVLDARARRAE